MGWKVVFTIIFICAAIGLLSFPKTPTEVISHWGCSYIHQLCPSIEILGSTHPDFDKVREAFEENYRNQLERHSQLVIYHKGEKVVDLAGKSCHFNCKNDSYSQHTLQNVFSTTKVIESTVIAMLVDKRHLDYHQKISFYWPEFGKHGKENVTLAELLKHEAGLCFVDDRDPSTEDVLPLFDQYPDYMERIERIFENSYLTYPSTNDTRTCYHGMTRGLILNSIVRRVENRTIGAVVRDEIAGPLNVDYYIGLNNIDPEKRASLPIMAHQSDSWGWRIRVVGEILIRYVSGNLLGFVDPLPVSPHNFARAIREVAVYGVFGSPLIRTAETIRGVFAITVADLHNLPHVRMVESPSSNGLANAQAMAKIMNEVLQSQHGSGLLSKETFSLLMEHSTPQYDASIHADVSYTTGGWACFHDAFGSFSGYCGWHGLGGAVLLLDTKTELAVGYTTTRIETISPWEDPRTLKLLGVARECAINKNNEL